MPGSRFEKPAGRMQARCARFPKTGTRYRVPDSVAGLRSSALGLDKGGGKVVPPLPLIPPWPRAGYRGPSRGTGYLVPGTRYPEPEPVRRRGPNTEHRRPRPATGKPAHRVCMMQDRKGSDSGYRVPGTWYLAPLPPIPQTTLNKALPLIPRIFIVPDDVKDGPASPAIIVGHG
jgi:hypothetical protein